jgi:ribonuclease E
LFVIDFIDMMSNKNQREVENRLRDALKIDRARIQTGRISRFGLMEMSRQRLRPSLGDSTQLTCPRCKGQGTIRNVESVTLAVLRLIEEEAMKKGTERVIAHLPIDCATFLLNEKRAAIQELEARLRVNIVVLPSKHLETPSYDIERIKSLEGLEDKASHLHIKEDDIAVPEFAKQNGVKAEKAAVKEFLPDAPAPAPVQNKKTSTSLIQRFWQRLIGRNLAATETEEKPQKKEERPNPGHNNRQQKDRNAQGRSNNNRRNNNRRNSGPAAASASAAAENSTVVSHANAPQEEIKPLQDNEAVVDNQAKNPGATQERSPRRNRNRRRSPRNGGEKRVEGGNGAEDGNQNHNSERAVAAPVTAAVYDNDAPRSPRPYASDFAERAQKQELQPVREPVRHEQAETHSPARTEE